MERKLAKQPEVQRKYHAFMQEYLELGHMKLVSNISEEQDENSNISYYYLPHHAILKESNDSKHLRVAFDTSAKTSTGLSLNDIQMIGPTIQQDLFSIITFSSTCLRNLSRHF